MKQQKMVSMGQVVLIAIVVSVITSLVVLVFGASLTGNATLYKLNSTTNITSVNTTAPRTLGNGTFNVVTANQVTVNKALNAVDAKFTGTINANTLTVSYINGSGYIGVRGIGASNYIKGENVNGTNMEGGVIMGYDKKAGIREQYVLTTGGLFFYGGKNQKIGMISSNGTQWYCGPTNSGQWNCSKSQYA